MRPPREDVGGREVLGEPERVPHGRDVEAAADAEPRGQVRQVHADHQDVRQALVALVLEVVLGQPERVVAVLVHAARDGLGLREDGRQVLVGVAALVGRRGVLAHVAEIDVAGVDRPNFVIMVILRGLRAGGSGGQQRVDLGGAETRPRAALPGCAPRARRQPSDAAGVLA